MLKRLVARNYGRFCDATVLEKGLEIRFWEIIYIVHTGDFQDLCSRTCLVTLTLVFVHIIFYSPNEHPSVIILTALTPGRAKLS